MKLTHTLRILSVASAASTALFFTSCGDKKEGEADSSDQQEEASKDTADSVTDELAAEFEAIIIAMETVKDKPSAEAAAKKMAAISDKMDAIAARLEKLETPSEEKKKELDAKMDTKMQALEKRMGTVMGSLSDNAEVGAVIIPALQKFGESMKKHDKTFERFGKKN